MIPLDRVWRRAHPLPPLGNGKGKAERGTVLVVGGSALSPGACILTAEAALRVGAGRVQIATQASSIPAIGAAFPECALIALAADQDGEIAGDAAKLLAELVTGCDAIVIGPGTKTSDGMTRLTGDLIAALGDDTALLLDAGAIGALPEHAEAVRARRSGCIITPHHGELSKLTGIDVEDIAADAPAAARKVADRHGAVVVLKDSETHIAVPNEELLCFESRAPGLGTAGSGDVLAGAITGLLARGLTPVDAAGWGVKLHGKAGRRVGRSLGQIGYLARDLLPELSSLTSKWTRG